MARRRWMLKAPRPPPKRKARGIQKAIARRLRDEKEKLAQWKLALEVEEEASKPSEAIVEGGEGGGVIDASSASEVKTEAAAATPADGEAANAMEIVTEGAEPAC